MIRSIQLIIELFEIHFYFVENLICMHLAQWSERVKKCTKPQKTENRWKNGKFEKCKLQVIKGSNFMLEIVGIYPETRQLRSFRCGQIKSIFQKVQFLTCYRALESSKQKCVLMPPTSVAWIMIPELSEPYISL